MRIPFSIPSRDARPFDVVGFGLNSIDLVAVVAEFPACNSKQRLQRAARLPGGQMATAMATCARLGWRARYVGRFGADDLGTASRESLIADGVDVSASQTMRGATNQFAIVLVDARTGERTVLWDRHPALNMEPADVSREAVTSGRMLIVDCHQTAAAAQAARFARAARVPTIIDVEKVRPGIGERTIQGAMDMALETLLPQVGFETVQLGRKLVGSIGVELDEQDRSRIALNEIARLV